MVGSAIFPSIAVAKKTGLKKDFFDETPKPIHLKKGVGKKGTVGGMDLLFRLTKNQTGGHMSCDEVTIKPGFLGAPPHLHRTIDEICYVIEGTVNILVGDEVFTVNAGDWHLRPRGIVHTFWNESNQPAKFIDIYLPGGHEEYMVELAALFENNNKPKPADFIKLANKYDIIYSWDKLEGIMKKYNVHL